MLSVCNIKLNIKNAHKKSKLVSLCHIKMKLHLFIYLFIYLFMYLFIYLFFFLTCDCFMFPCDNESISQCCNIPGNTKSENLVLYKKQFCVGKSSLMLHKKSNLVSIKTSKFCRKKGFMSAKRMLMLHKKYSMSSKTS